MPRAVVFGPTKYGGMDWDNHSTIVLYEKLKMLIGLIRLQDKVGNLIMIQLSWIQHIVGISTPMSEYRKYLQYILGGWIYNVQKHLVHHDVQVKIHNAWVPKA